MANAALVAVLLAAVAWAGCADTSEVDGGLEGMVTIGPTCPVERDPPDPQCADKPYAGHFEVTTTEGRLVQLFSSQDDGTFVVHLEPGRYMVRSGADAPSLPSCPTVGPFEVKPGQFTRVEFSCDSGIR